MSNYSARTCNAEYQICMKDSGPLGGGTGSIHGVAQPHDLSGGINP
jgi:hypothetical protein